MIYKYKVGKKWFTFDKSLLQPEDLQIFDKADWTDKLKIITIYKDLKENEDDTVNVLSFKKENANKDKRRIEYANKKEKLMNNIKELNKKEQTKQTTDEIEKLQKELKDLEIEYADVVNINTANTLNVSNVNTLNLNNIEKIKTSIKETEKKFEEVKNLLSAEDINKIKQIFENLKSSNDVEEFKKVISELKTDLLRNLPKELAVDFENLENKIDSLTTSTNEQFEELKNAIESRKLNKLIELTKEFKDNAQNISKEIYDNLDKLFNFNELYQIYKDFNDDKIEIYYNIPPYKERMIQPLNYNNFKDKYIPFDSKSNQKTVQVCKYINDNEEYKYKKIFMYVITSEVDTAPLFENLIDIYKRYNNINQANGFLGLKTNKEAKKEQKQINDKLDEVFKTIRELSNRVAAQQTDLNEVKKEIDVLKNVKVERFEQSETKPRIKNQEIQNVRLRKPARAERSEQPNQQPQQQKTFEDSLKEIMNIRRKDIEPDDYTDDSDEWLANGFEDVDEIVDENVGVAPIGGTAISSRDAKASNKIKLAGSLLEELKEDLKNYGLALNFNIYKKRARAERSERGKEREPKQQPSKTGNGIVEAKKINDSITKSTDYTDLKELYEDLYE